MVFVFIMAKSTGVPGLAAFRAEFAIAPVMPTAKGFLAIHILFLSIE
jgi:hypothetical protein